MTIAYEKMHRRVRKMQSRLRVRGWEFRQRHGSKGAWLRLARQLCDAEQAWAIDEAGAERLERAGHAPLAAGLEFHPPLRLYIASAKELEDLNKTPLAVRLDGTFLGSGCVALIPFRRS